MVDRLMITLMIIGGLGICWLGWRYYKVSLVQTIQSSEPGLNKPFLLYFTGEYCSACKLQQTPIVDNLVAKFGDSIVVREYDVSHYPELASQYQVLTLPTTVILNQLGQVVHVNYGVTSQTKLEAQLS
jgi:thioredoxin 1